MPHHGHDGTEFTLVLSGGFSDGRGSYGPGDVCMANPTRSTNRSPTKARSASCSLSPTARSPLPAPWAGFSAH
ncbi:MAG: cupin domain-containing protein [Oceanicaulis sp.]|nr:cupin domain-containing protein [Oceanicaulis sp.]